MCLWDNYPPREKERPSLAHTYSTFIYMSGSYIISEAMGGSVILIRIYIEAGKCHAGK